MTTTKKVYAKIKTMIASAQKRNRLIDSRGRIIFAKYLYSRYIGSSDKTMMTNTATALIFIKIRFDLLKQS